MATVLTLVQFALYLICSNALLKQGLPTTRKLPDTEAAYIHQILNQESSLRMDLEKQMTSLQSTVYTMQQDLLKIKAENLVLKNSPQPGAVMFSAYLSKSVTKPNAEQVIIFDKTWVNIFTPTVPGYYHFSLTVATHMHNVWLSLKHNGTPVATVIGDIHHTGYYGRGSMTLILRLNTGDNVWISQISLWA
ncbi:C1QA [Mytilus edulis]|uniref:C1QA n=1 Tax=Mytilus edulis TaxID=6550 RepID=A0A8S3SMX1_MYTED|nr:C1QA [Mytilus edulis]